MPGPLWLLWLLWKNNCARCLLQQLQHTLGHLVRLGQHGLGGLDQNVVLDRKSVV